MTFLGWFLFETIEGGLFILVRLSMLGSVTSVDKLYHLAFNLYSEQDFSELN
jgi:hypothetical protein